jgi:long-chain fatty acid transport protein
MLSGQAWAGGFMLQEQSPTGLGRAFAGDGALADDASVIFYNPAGMTLLKGVTATLGVYAIFIDSHQSDRGSTRATGAAAPAATGGGDGGNPFDQPVPIPSNFIAAPLTDRLWLGIGVTAPFGMKVVYDQGWFGRYDSIRSDVKTFNAQPSFAYKLNDRISIGGGVDVQYIKAELSNALPNIGAGTPDGLLRIKGDDVSVGWNVGLLAELPGMRMGLHYRSGIKHDLGSRLSTSGLEGALAAGNGTVKANARVPLPDVGRVAIAIGPDKPLRLLASAAWYNWSVFDAIRVTPEGGATISDPQHYRDTWSVSLGGEYQLRPGVTLRAGAMYDKSPTRDGFRSTRVSGGDKAWASAGASIAVTHRMTADLNYAHVFIERADVARTDSFYEGTAAETQTVTRSRDRGNVDMVSVALTTRF